MTRVRQKHRFYTNTGEMTTRLRLIWTSHNWRLVENRKKAQTADGASIRSADTSVTFPVCWYLGRNSDVPAVRLPRQHPFAVGITMKKGVHSKEETIQFLFLNPQAAAF